MSATIQPVRGPNPDGSIDTNIASVPLPTGAATAANQVTEIASLANLDVALSTRLKPADTLTKVTTVDTITNPVTVSATNLDVRDLVFATDKMDVTGSTVSVTGSVTANAGSNLNTSLLALESGGNLATLVGKDFSTETTLAAVKTSVEIIDNWDEANRAAINPIVGQAGVQGGSGTVTAATQRIVLATDIALPAGTNNIGDVDVLTLPALSAGTNIIGKTRPAAGVAETWIFQSTFQALAQNKLFFDLFNASGSGKIIRVTQIVLQKNMAAVTGVAVQFNLNYTTSAGTGGTVLTPITLDSTNTALPAQITAMHAATGGASLGSLLVSRFYHSEETNVAAQVQESFPFWPMAFPYSAAAQDIVLRANEGLALKQITSTTAGTYNCAVIFTVE